MMNKKELIDIVIMPLTVGLVGIVATYFITETQNSLSKELVEIQEQNARALAEQQYTLQIDQHEENKDREITNTFFELHDDEEFCAKKERVNLLISDASPARAEILNTRFNQWCEEKNGVSVDNSAVLSSTRSRILGYIADLDGAARSVARDRLTDLYRNNKELAGDIFAETIKNNLQHYRITFGLLVVLSRVENWQSTEALNEQFLRLGKLSLNMKTEAFNDYYQMATKERVVSGQ